MSDYISREAAIEAAKHAWAKGLEPSQYLEIIPPADVEPVRRGEWLLKHIGHGHYWECSECHTNPCIYVTKDTKFCPNCGAKMDLEVCENDS